jgi:protein SCO1/2
MVERPAVPRPEDAGAAVGDRAFVLVLALALLLVILAVVGFALGGATPRATTSPSPSPMAGSFLYAQVRDAPPLDLIDPDARPFSLASLRGQQVLVFFGYTHCPDVCPATIGVVGKVIGAVGSGVRAIFVSIDPERDTTTWLKEYEQYLPKGFTALTGTPTQVRTTADGWGVRYARVETGSKDGYSMSHTADVFLVDAAGRLRASFPFGTGPEAMIGTLRAVAASTPASATPPSAGASASPTPAPTPAGVGALRPEVVSTSVWAGARTPVILALNDHAGRLNDTSISATVQLTTADGSAVGPATEAVVIRPPLVDRVSYVATVDIPQPGPWRLEVTAVARGTVLAGSVAVTALDPGTTAALGAPAPDAHTPTLDDVGGNARAITTDPQPDLRLSRRSTTDALAAHVPFVLVIDSTRFRVTPACGKAIVMARYLADRWPDVAFIHLEPYRYSLVADTPVLVGDISDPTLGPIAAAWGIGGSPWGARSMPWVFVVDGSGVVRAKYQGLMGSDDVDVILSLVTGASLGNGNGNRQAPAGV